MTIVRLKIDEPYRNMDESMPSTAANVLYDCDIDRAGAVTRRFGLVELCDLGTNASVDGLAWNEPLAGAIAVSNGNVYKITAKTGSFQSITGDAVISGSLAAIEELYNSGTTEPEIYIANGEEIVYTNGTSLTAQLADGNAPQVVDQLVGLDTYLITNDKTSATTSKQWFASTVLAPRDWTTAKYTYNAQQSSDAVNTIKKYGDKVAIIGYNSTEYWVNTGDTDPFSPMKGATIAFGCANPFAAATLGNSLAFFSAQRELIVLNGFTPVIVSEAYANEFQKITNTNDVSMMYMNAPGGKRYIVLNFIDGNKTIAYNVDTQTFSEWTYWNPTTNTRERFRGRCYTYARAWGYHLVGDKSNGKIYRLEPTTYNDDGDTMRSTIITGWYDHGTAKNKRSKSLQLELRCGDGISGDTYRSPICYIGWRDNQSLVWGKYIPISTGQVGQANLKHVLRPMGMYRQRQYEITMGDNAPFYLASLEEEVEIIG